MKIALALLLALSWSSGLFAAPASDLSSPSQAIRDSAASVLRTNYTAAGRTNWDEVVSKIKKGDTKATVMALFSDFGPEQESFLEGSTTMTVSYRLDDRWILVCQWEKSADRSGVVAVNDKLVSFQAAEQLRGVWVSPPRYFTGVWTTYYVNGQPCLTIHYRSGNYMGEYTSYRPDGTRAYVQNYTARGCDGEETGYYPSGKVLYKGTWTKGFRVGSWVWFNEDGTVKSQKLLERPRGLE